MTWPLSPAKWSSDASFSVPSFELESLVPSAFGKMKNAMSFGSSRQKTDLPTEGAKFAFLKPRGPSLLHGRHHMLTDKWTRCSIPHVVESYKNFRPVRKGLPFYGFL